jgi:hypothetical protein
VHLQPTAGAGLDFGAEPTGECGGGGGGGGNGGVWASVLCQRAAKVCLCRERKRPGARLDRTDDNRAGSQPGRGEARPGGKTMAVLRSGGGRPSSSLILQRVSTPSGPRYGGQPAGHSLFSRSRLALGSSGAPPCKRCPRLDDPGGTASTGGARECDAAS